MIEVRLLTGQRFSVQLPADATVLELKAALTAQHGLGSCRLNLRVSADQREGGAGLHG